jgi:hypothetical protein
MYSKSKKKCRLHQSFYLFIGFILKFLFHQYTRIFVPMKVNAVLISCSLGLFILLNACAGAKTDASIIVQEKIDSAVLSTVTNFKQEQQRINDSIINAIASRKADSIWAIQQKKDTLSKDTTKPTF